MEFVPGGRDQPVLPPQKKANVAEHYRVSHHVGLLVNEPPGPAGLPFVQSSDDSGSSSLRSKIPVNMLAWDRAGIQQQLRALGGRHHGRRRS
jgi:hypothetical protein